MWNNKFNGTFKLNTQSKLKGVFYVLYAGNSNMSSFSVISFLCNNVTKVFGLFNHLKIMVFSKILIISTELKLKIW